MNKIIVSLVITGLLIISSVSASAQESSTLTWVGCGISKQGFMAEMANAYRRRTGIDIVIQGGGATKGIRQVSSGQADLGGSCRDVINHPIMISPISEERWAKMNPVAWDALAVIVHKDNSVTDITTQQVKDLFKGKIKNWSELGGSDQAIKLLIRRGKISGVGRTIRELVFGNYEEEFVASEIFPSSGPLEKAVEARTDVIAITGISSARRRDVSVLNLDGVAPTFDRIRDGGYSLYRPLYLVTPMQLDVKPGVRDFLDFVRSEEGKAVMREVGTVPHEDAIPTWLKYLQRREEALFGND
ncbi:MAG: phosphate transport system substrate-binding protein [Parasphingorhabdus sp.]|jgi:phosphate transport system substrate-binding protein